MEIDLFSRDELPMVFRVLRTALNEDALNSAETSFLEVYAKICQIPLPNDLEAIEPSAVQIPDTHKAKRLVQLASMAALLSRPLRPSALQFVTQLDTHLNVHEPVIPVLHAVARGRKWRARFMTIRRMVRVILGETYRAEGLIGIFRFWIAILAQARVNKDKLWAYKRLGLLPDGTLGREYWAHIIELGFGFPGEPGGIPQTVSYHDVSHVLNDYDTTPAGEIQQGSFQGGCRREGGFGFVQFVLLQFHHGIKITPVAPGEVGNFDPARVLWAIHRGANFNADVTTNWDYWPLMSLPIEEARTRCGLIPKLSA